MMPGWFGFQLWGFPMFFMGMGLLLSVFYLDGRITMVRTEGQHQFRQQEAWSNILRILSPKYPLPASRGWAASPDFLEYITHSIFFEKPELLIECGGGLSTIIIGHALKKVGKGKLISLDHDEYYAQQTKAWVEEHRLEDVVDVVFAPLREYTLNDKSWLWYDWKPIKDTAAIDLLVVDGPPSGVQKEARYPAVPLLNEYLTAKASVLVDDYRRPDEQALVDRWANEYGWEIELLRAEKGACRLKRKRGTTGS